MLARRFTIVCLLTLVFALAFANLVIASRSERHWTEGAVYRCSPIHAVRCPGFTGWPGR
jgi:hypothetical protein